MGQTTTSGTGISQHIPPAAVPPPPGPPFALTSADNGLSVDPVTKRIVLGNAAAALAAALLSDREIPLGLFKVSFVGADYLGTPHRIRISDDLIEMIGENDVANGTHLTMTDLNTGLVTDITNTGSTLQITSGANVNISANNVNAEIIMTARDIVAGVGPLITGSPQIGFDVQGTFNAAGVVKTLMALSLNDAASDPTSLLLDLLTNNLSVFSVDKTGTVAIKNFADGTIFDIALANGTGIASMQNSGTDLLQFDLNTNNIHAVTNFDVQDVLGARNAFFDVLNHKSFVGDVDLATSGAQLKVDNTTGVVSISSLIGGSKDIFALFIDGAAGRYEIGDLQVFANGTAMRIDDTTGQIDMSSGLPAGPVFTMNGAPGFTGTVTPVTSITVVGGIVTAVS